MNGGPSQAGRVLESAVRDLRLHKLAKFKRRADAEWDAFQWNFPAEQARIDHAALSPERRAQLEAEWNGDAIIKEQEHG